MSDVAVLAGVSHQTVSRVLNEHPNVSRATRAKVLEAIEALGYRRNLSARALATGRSNVVGVIAQNTTLFGPSSTIAALSVAALDVGMAVTLGHLRDFDRTSMRATVDRLMSQGVAGIILLLPLLLAEDVIGALPGDVPLVTVDGPPDWQGSNVLVDQERGGVLATEHLLAAGHRSVWHVAGPEAWNDSRARQRGWERALADAGQDAPPVLRADWSPRSGHEAGRLLARIPDCTAVFAANDHVALGLTRALAEHGRSVPGDVSIVGYDDVPESEFFSPPLTTVRQDFDRLGHESLGLLTQQARAGDRTPQRVLIDPVLVERSSVVSATVGA
ncbi:LacI family transcriptional regulator [Angustibacter aerolatus]|uniref:LacI family transcriptional regulator n=1 Tax=Angustibacter aerolatus TaxID=1162965 RepID=A0ABQ6JCB5_9ACTN|nr:LacI family transcriptional regulator [Angustibacter aerolatus]